MPEYVNLDENHRLSAYYIEFQSIGDMLTGGKRRIIPACEV